MGEKRQTYKDYERASIEKNSKIKIATKTLNKGQYKQLSVNIRLKLLNGIKFIYECQQVVLQEISV